MRARVPLLTIAYRDAPRGRNAIALPPRILISGRWWKVRRRSLINVRHGRRKDPRSGMTDYERRTITISWGLTDDELIAAFVHEVIHASCHALTEDAVLMLEEDLLRSLYHVNRMGRR